MGTFMLVFTVGCNVQSVKLDPKAQGVFVAVSIASSLMICIYALGDHPLQIILHAHAVLHNMDVRVLVPLFVLGVSKHYSHFVTASTHVHMIRFTEKGADICASACLRIIIQVPLVAPTSTLQSLWVSVCRANWITARASSTGSRKSSQVLTLTHAHAKL